MQYRDRTGAAHDIIAIYSRDLLRRLLLGAAACKVALLAIDPMAEANEAVTILSIDNLVAQLKGSGK
ncbi:MAG TPA: hypothetical protein VFE62_13755 [Gemmataceae bacterium]|nr:hypothetical protein [Gemmataceae bacterium]